MRNVTTECSNCLGDITLSFIAGTATVKVKAHGRAGKRVEAQTLTTMLVNEADGFYTWEAPCCDGYSDSYEEPRFQ